MRRNVYIGGEQVGRDDHRLRPGINVMDITFDLAQESRFKGLATAHSPIVGEEVNRWAHLPQNAYDLLQKQKLIRLGARRGGGCIQRCMGQDAINALAVCTKEMDEVIGMTYHQRFLEYIRTYQKQDLDACCAQTDSKGDRLKRPSAQENPDAYVHLVEENAEANNITKVSHVREKLAEFASAAALAFSAGVAAALYGERTSSGVFFPNRIYANVGRRLTGELIYHEYNLLTEVAGGIAATMPFHEDFKEGDNIDHLKRFIVRNPNLSAEESIKIWKFIEDIGTSSMSAWYKIAGVHGGGSPIMETIALNLEYDFEDKKKLARYLAGIDEELDDSALIDMEPALGTSLV